MTAMTLACPPAFSQLEDSPALYQSNDQNDYGDDQKNMDQAAKGVSRHQTQKPQNEQDDYDCPEHMDLLFSFRLSPFRCQPFVKSRMDWRGASRLEAVFMPESSRVLRMSGS
jgi:hypothetical protein